MRLPNFLADDELKNYAETHLQYEVNMLSLSVSVLASLARRANTSPLPWLLSNGILNTFAIHARNLIDFLYSRSRGRDYPTDIIIQDYVGDNEISLHLRPISPLLEKALIKANKQVAHLSMDRIEYERLGKEWRYIEVMGHIRDAFASIAPYVPAAKMSSELRGKLSATSVAIPLVDITSTNSSNGQVGIAFSLRER